MDDIELDLGKTLNLLEMNFQVQLKVKRGGG
jgi:hypothetical protein